LLDLSDAVKGVDRRLHALLHANSKPGHPSKLRRGPFDVTTEAPNRSDAWEFFHVGLDALAEIIDDARGFLAEFIPKQRKAEQLAQQDSDGRILLPGDVDWERYRALPEIRESLTRQRRPPRGRRFLSASVQRRKARLECRLVSLPERLSRSDPQHGGESLTEGKGQRPRLCGCQVVRVRQPNPWRGERRRALSGVPQRPSN
jgi:hypothetical protein